jgi:hypothetical protein
MGEAQISSCAKKVLPLYNLQIADRSRDRSSHTIVFAVRQRFRDGPRLLNRESLHVHWQVHLKCNPGPAGSAVMPTSSTDV